MTARMACTGFAGSRAGSGVKATEVLKGRLDAAVDLVYCEMSRRDVSVAMKKSPLVARFGSPLVAR